MSYCECGGWLGSGGIDGYSGRYCRCASPRMATSLVSTGVDLSVMFNKDVTIQDLRKEVTSRDARIAELEKVNNDLVKKNVSILVMDYISQGTELHFSNKVKDLEAKLAAKNAQALNVKSKVEELVKAYDLTIIGNLETITSLATRIDKLKTAMKDASGELDGIKEVYATTAKEFITTALAEDEKIKEGT